MTDLARLETGVTRGDGDDILADHVATASGGIDCRGGSGGGRPSRRARVAVVAHTVLLARHCVGTGTAVIV